MISTAPHIFDTQSDNLNRFMFTYWQRLVELGMPVSEAQKVAKTVAKYRAAKRSKLEQRLAKVRATAPSYWRKLIEAGVPINEAKHIAEAIAEYDVAQKAPNARDRKLINQYCRFVCRAELWRSNMLTQS